jgi:hypothetical protein
LAGTPPILSQQVVEKKKSYVGISISGYSTTKKLRKRKYFVFFADRRVLPASQENAYLLCDFVYLGNQLKDTLKFIRQLSASVFRIRYLADAVYG